MKLGEVVIVNGDRVLGPYVKAGGRWRRMTPYERLKAVYQENFIAMTRGKENPLIRMLAR